MPEFPGVCSAINGALPSLSIRTGNPNLQISAQLQSPPPPSTRSSHVALKMLNYSHESLLHPPVAMQSMPSRPPTAAITLSTSSMDLLGWNCRLSSVNHLEDADPSSCSSSSEKSLTPDTNKLSSPGAGNSWRLVSTTAPRLCKQLSHCHLPLPATSFARFAHMAKLSPEYQPNLSRQPRSICHSRTYSRQPPPNFSHESLDVLKSP